MNRYDENYSAYFKAPSKEYPEGSAVDSSSEDNLDGTPYLAAFFDDVIGFMYAAFHGVFGNPQVSGETVERELSNKPDNAIESDVWDAIKTFVQRKADAVSGALTSAINGVKQSLDEFIATKGKANGFASLDASGQVPASQLPSYVDDVLEYARRSAFPASGEKGKIYVALDTNKSYRWSGTTYIELSKYDDATQSASGLMSASDKTKLDGIESGAQRNTVTSVSGRTGAVTNDQIRGDMSEAAQSAKGLMSAADKTKLDGIQAGAQVNTVTSVSGRTGAVTNDQIREDMATMGAATATAAGTKGLVPPPAANMMGAFLMGNGTWGFPESATVDSALNPDSTNSVQNKAVTANVYGVICSDKGNYKTAKIFGFTLIAGAVVRVLFTEANSDEVTTLDVNGTGAKTIVAHEHGQKHCVGAWDAGTTMNLIFDGAGWVVMDNPVLLSFFGLTKGYIKYANGLIMQWMNVTSKDDGSYQYTLPISFSNAEYICIPSIADGTDRRGYITYKNINNSTCQLVYWTYGNSEGKVGDHPLSAFFMGY